MREIKIYKFEELSEEAKEKALSQYRNEMEENESWEAQNWAIDDCALFEPKHDEMVDAVGPDYYEKNGEFVMANRRTGINTDGYYLNIQEALEITNSTMFKKWLGVPDMFIDNVDYDISTDNGSTSIELEHDRLIGDPLADALTGILDNAETKFSNHIEDIIRRIELGTEEYFSADNVMDRIEEDSELEFLKDGTIWNS